MGENVSKPPEMRRGEGRTPQRYPDWPPFSHQSPHLRQIGHLLPVKEKKHRPVRSTLRAPRGFSPVADEAREELFAIFPELRVDPRAYGSTARRCLKKHEAKLIRA